MAAADFFLGKESAKTPAEMPTIKYDDTTKSEVPQGGFDWEYYKRYRKVRKRRLGY